MAKKRERPKRKAKAGRPAERLVVTDRDGGKFTQVLTSLKFTQ